MKAMKKKVKRSRQRKRRTAGRLKKEKWFDNLLFTHFQIEEFFERRKKEHLNKVFPYGGVIQDQAHDLGGEYIAPKRILTTTTRI